MYETGVAYFERGGRMQAGKDLQLPLPAGHLDDALKTLVVLSPGAQAKLGGVSFETAVSEGAARAFAGLPEDGDDQLDYDVVLRSFEGQRVEVQLEKESFRGRLLEVEGPLPPPPPVEGEAVQAIEAQFNLVVLDASGAVRRLHTERVRRVRPLEPGARERIELAAASLSDQSAQRSHDLNLQVERAGRVELGYVAEAPVWRTSYRVVLTDDGQALMQAWALIHNDTDEAWRGVDIELANGEPTSFLFPMAAPRYARRELRAPEVDLYTVPQLLLETADGMWADGTGLVYETGMIGRGGLGVSGYGRGGGGSGYGTIGTGTVGTVGTSGSLALGDLADFAQADGSESEAQFVYKLAESVDLPAHHSALVPVFASAIDARSIALFVDGQSEALHGLRLVNSTRQSLPAGTVALFADGGFSGEATLDRLKPGEPRYIGFGKDLDVELEKTHEPKGKELRALTFANGKITEHVVNRFDIVLRVRNRASRARHAYVALELPRNAELESESPLDWDPVRTQAMVNVTVDGHGHTESRVRAGTAGTQVYGADSISREKLGAWSKVAGLSDPVRSTVRKALEITIEIESVEDKLVRNEAKQSEALTELERRRADLAALGAAGQKGESARKAAKRIESLEQEIAALHSLRKELVATGAKLRVARLEALQTLPRSL